MSSKANINKEDDLIQIPCNMIACGMTESGKSHMVKSLFAMNYHKFDYAVVFSKTVELNNDYDYIPEEYRYDEFDVEIIEKIMIKQSENKKAWLKDKKVKLFRVCILIDDSVGTINMSTKNNIFDKLFPISRHYNISIWVCTQHLAYVSPAIRGNTHYFLVSQIHASTVDLAFQLTRGFKSKKQFEDFLEENMTDYKMVMFNNKNAYSKEKYKIIKAPEEIPNFKMKY